MNEKTYLWAALAVAAIAGLSATMAFLEPPAAPSPARSVLAAASYSPTNERAALECCQLMAQPDDACRLLWLENRRHFVGLDKPRPASK